MGFYGISFCCMFADGTINALFVIHPPIEAIYLESIGETDLTGKMLSMKDFAQVIH